MTHYEYASWFASSVGVSLTSSEEKSADDAFMPNDEDGGGDGDNENTNDDEPPRNWPGKDA